MIQQKKSLKLAGILTAFLLGGCITTSLPLMRAETAQRIASAAWLLKRDITAGDYKLRTYERMHERNSPANIYIEGNALESTSPGEFTGNPTPKNPLALHLASKDNADNVAYLALPCQYNNHADDQECSMETWTQNRFSEDKIIALNAALDDIARRYDITGFNLIGYDDGAVLASLLATKRVDILSLRTVAGKLSYLSQTPDTSTNASEISQALSRLPQYHFIGGQDLIAPPSAFHAYKQSMPANSCVNSMLVQEAEHEDGWVNKWSELLKLGTPCTAPYTDEPYIPQDPPPVQHTVIPERPEKP